MNVKYIFSMHLAGYLMMNKCPIKGMHPNAKNPSKDVYIFEDTELLNELIKKYKKD